MEQKQEQQQPEKESLIDFPYLLIAGRDTTQTNSHPSLYVGIPKSYKNKNDVIDSLAELLGYIGNPETSKKIVNLLENSMTLSDDERSIVSAALLVSPIQNLVRIGMEDCVDPTEVFRIVR